MGAGVWGGGRSESPPKLVVFGGETLSVLVSSFGMPFGEVARARSLVARSHTDAVGFRARPQNCVFARAVCSPPPTDRPRSGSAPRASSAWEEDLISRRRRRRRQLRSRRTPPPSPHPWVAMIAMVIALLTIALLIAMHGLHGRRHTTRTRAKPRRRAQSIRTCAAGTATFPSLSVSTAAPPRAPPFPRCSPHRDPLRYPITFDYPVQFQHPPFPFPRDAHLLQYHSSRPMRTSVRDIRRRGGGCHAWRAPPHGHRARRVGLGRGLTSTAGHAHPHVLGRRSLFSWWAHGHGSASSCFIARGA